MTLDATIPGTLEVPLRDVGSDDPYAFTAFPFPFGHFRVHAIEGREALSKPYWFKVTVMATSFVGEDLERITIGQRAALVMRLGGPPRVIPGVVTAVRSDGVRPHDHAAQLTFRIAPAMSLLRHQRSSRIFQDKRVDEIVDSVLKGSGVRTRWELGRPYAARSYVTQYEETDLEFVQRLLAEEGIYYTFLAPEPGATGILNGASSFARPIADVAALVQSAAGAVEYPQETILFADDASRYPSIVADGPSSIAASVAEAVGAPAELTVGPVTVGTSAPALKFLDALGVVTERHDKVTELTALHSVRSGVAEYREFDPARPQSLLVSRAGDRASATRDEGVGVPASLAETAGDLAKALADLLTTRVLETYEHHGNYLFPDWQEGSDLAKRIVRQRSRKRMTAKGRSLCSALSPGHRFTLEEHPIGDFNREHVVVEIEHRGTNAMDAESYHNRFTCVPATVTYPPARPTRRTVQTLLTATVVGPGAEEIHTDSWGRIKVLFHWDRRRTSDDTASCWIRCVQPWSGAGFGHQFIPRVGMEVAVAFEGGDTDKPIVVGSLYNGTNPPAFILPANKTVSGIRTRTVPGGNGFNELSFEDAASRERVHLHAQRDYDEVVRNDKSVHVGADERIRVDGARSERIGKGHRLEVGGDLEEHVRGNVAMHHESRLDVVESHLDQRVTGTRTTRVEGRDEIDVRGVAEQRFSADLTTRVVGNQTLIVGKHDARRSFALRVEGTATISTEDGLELESNKGITLRCGKTSLRIGSDGIELVGAMIRAAGETSSVEVNKEGVKLAGPKTTARLGEKLLLESEEATFSMGKEMKLDGPKILVNSPDMATEEPPPEAPPLTEIELLDQSGKPLPRQRFVIQLEDGSQRIGVTDKDGVAKLELPSNGEVRFPDLSEVEDY